MRAGRVLRQSIKAVHLRNAGSTVTVNGWINSVRKLKRVAFADVTDGSTSQSLMVVMTPDEAKNLNTGTCVSIEGELKESQGAGQDKELLASKVGVLGRATPDYPLQKKYHSPEFLRSIPQFRWKTTTNAAVLRYRSYAQLRIARYFEDEGFTQVTSPLVTSSDCEGAGETFNIRAPKNAEFFGKPQANLTVSSQLHLEVFAAALSKVWNMTPAFRAEESDTNRHLSEFWMVEAELAFTKSLEDVMTVAENMVRAAVPSGEAATDLLRSVRDESRLELMQKRWAVLSGESKWPRITYDEAVERVQQNGKLSKSIRWGEGLASEHEKWLAGEVFKSPVFVTDYPASIKPFYMKKSSENTVACFDLLVPDVGELIGGSLREDDYDTLITAMQNDGMSLDDMAWYTDLRLQGSFPHGGFGMGFERLVCFACGVENIRDAIGFPRWAGSCVC